MVVHDARARLVDAHTVGLSDGGRVTAKHILVATGGRPERPDLPNAHLGLVSDDIFLLERLPKSVLIVGGGFIACEMACILNGLGVKVTQFYRGAQILRGFDDEARGLVAEAMKEQGIDLHLGTNIVEMAEARAVKDHAGEMGADVSASADLLPTSGEKGCPVWVKSTNGHEATYDAVLFATGRAPNSAGLGLEDLGVKIGRRGEIVVDAYSQTAVPSVYAIGDVTHRVNLTPVAIREGMAFARRQFGGLTYQVDYDFIPTAVFCQPNIGTVGFTEEEARAKFGRIRQFKTSFKPMKHTISGRDERTFMKLIVDQASDRVIGVHMMGPDAGEIMQGIAIAMRAGATKAVFDSTIGIHPTAAEEFVTMREAWQED